MNTYVVEVESDYASNTDPSESFQELVSVICEDQEVEAESPREALNDLLKTVTDLLKAAHTTSDERVRKYSFAKYLDIETSFPNETTAMLSTTGLLPDEVWAKVTFTFRVLREVN